MRVNETLSELALYTLMALSIFVLLIEAGATDYTTTKVYEQYYDRIDSNRKLDWQTCMSDPECRTYEAVAVGGTLITYPAYKLFGFKGAEVFIRIVEVVFMVLSLYAVRKLTGSFKISLLMFVYYPFLLDSFRIGTSGLIVVNVFIVAMSSYLFITGRKNVAYFLSMFSSVFSHEGIALAGTFFLADNIVENNRFVLKFKNLNKIVYVIIPIVFHMVLMNYFFGHPFASIIYNKYAIRNLYQYEGYKIAARLVLYALIPVILYYLYFMEKRLFIPSLVLGATYLYFGFFGFRHLFYEIFRHFCNLLPFGLYVLAKKITLE